MTTPTSHYNFPKPIVGADSGSWGTTLNLSLDAIDQQIFTQAGALSANNLNLSNNPGTGIPGTLTFINSTVPIGQQRRWILQEDTSAEVGGGAGSNLSLSAYSDTGVLLSTPIAINRASGGITFGTAVTYSGAVTFNNITATGTATFSNITVTGAATLAAVIVPGTATLATVNASGTVTGGNLVSNGNLIASGTAAFNSGVATIRSKAGALNPTLLLQDQNGTNRGLLQFFEAAGNFQISNVGSWIALPADSSFQTNASVTSKPGGGAWQTASDERIKTVKGDYEAGLDEVLQLRPVTYTYRGNDTAEVDGESPHKGVAQTGKEFVGFIAQELEQVMPDMVGRHAGFIDGEAVSDIRDVDVSSLVYALCNAVRQLKAEIEALKAG